VVNGSPAVDQLTMTSGSSSVSSSGSSSPPRNFFAAAAMATRTTSATTAPTALLGDLDLGFGFRLRRLDAADRQRFADRSESELRFAVEVQLDEGELFLAHT
jgi:hypothetical protein